MAAILPKLNLTQVQTNPAAGTAVPPGTIVTYKITIASDPLATAGSTNASLALILGSNLTLNPGSVVVTDPNGGTDTVTPTAGSGGFSVAFSNTIATNAQPITITYQATVGAATAQNSTLSPTANVTYQNASPDELVYATDNVRGQFYQYDVTTKQLSIFGTPAYKQDSVAFDGRGNLIFTGQATTGQASWGLSSYNLTTGITTLLVSGQGQYDLVLSTDGTKVYFNGTSNGHKALYAYDLNSGTNKLVIENAGTTGFAGLAFDAAGHLFADYGAVATGYASSGVGNVVQLDPTTGTILHQSTNLGNTIDGLLYDSYSGHLFVSSSASTGITPNLWELDPITLAIVKTFNIDGGSGLDGLSSDGKGNIFIADYHNSIVQLNLVSGTTTVVASTPEIDDTIPVTSNPIFNSTATTPTLVGSGSLSGTVFLDQNADGQKLAGDTALAGVTVQLLDSTGAAIAGKTAITGASGNYSFTNLTVGNYAVAVSAPTGDAFSSKGTNSSLALNSIVNTSGATTNVAVTIGATTLNQNAGLYAPVTLSGTVFNDANDNGAKDPADTAHAGVVVQLLDSTGTAIAGKTATTDASGNYSFAGLKPGTYSVAVTPIAGGSFSPVGTSATLPDSAVTSLGKTTPVTLASGQTSANNNAGLFVPGALSGTVFLDQNADGQKLAGDTALAGVTVQLLDSTGAAIAGKTAITDASGNYSFTGLIPGSYAVAVAAPAGNVFSPVGANANPALDSLVASTGKTTPVAVAGGATTLNQNAGLYAPATLSGIVFQDTNGNGVKDIGEVPVAGDKVTLLNGFGSPTGLTTTTDTFGKYSFSGLTPGAYAVSIAPLDGESFSPIGTDPNPALDSIVAASGNTMQVTLTSGQNVQYQNAGVYVPASITGNAFLDTHCDGSDDYGDPAFKGIVVKLYDGLGNFTGLTSTTDASGSYNFGNLAPGKYQLQYALPTGTEFTDGSPGTDSNVNPLTGFSPIFMLVAGQTDTSHNVGLELTGGYANSPTSYLDATHTALGGNGSPITIIGGSGPENDVLAGGTGNNILVGGHGSNIIESGSGTNLILGGCGDYAQIQSLGTNDFVFGGKGDDLIQGHAGNAFIAAGPGNQTINGGGGTNTFIANTNRGTIDYNAGVFSNIAVGDTFITSGHTNSIYEKGDGVLYIEDYDASQGDTLSVYGFSGPTAVGQVGAYEVLYFGPDQAVLLRATASTITNPNLGVTYSASLPTTPLLTVQIDANNYLTLTMAGASTPVSGMGPGAAMPPVAIPPAPGPTSNTIVLTQANPNYTGGDTATTVTGPNYDVVKLGNGNNTVTLDGYSNSVTVGDGNNAIAAGIGNNTILAGNGANTISATGYSNTATVGTGSDTIDIGFYANIHAAGGNQTIHLNGYSNMVFIGGAGASVITGGLGNSQITTTGGSANITLGGYSNVVTTGAASDTITDGNGYSTFVIGSTHAGQVNGTETILNFAADGKSLIDFVPLAANGQSAAQLFASLHTNAGGNAEIDFLNGGSVIFQGLAPSQLHLTNFQVG